MSELAATAERLRLVKEACVDFITLWAVDRMMDENRLSDRIYRDLQAGPSDSGGGGSDLSFIQSSFLHSGRLLDD